MFITISPKTRVSFYCCFLALGGFLFGYNNGIISGLLLMPSFQQYMMIEKDLTNSSLISLLMLGAFVGSIISGPLADKIGRKALMILGLLIFIFGDTLQVAATGINILYAGRSISGVSLGILSMVVPLCKHISARVNYLLKFMTLIDQSEMAPKNMRGRLMSIQQFAIASGTAVSTWLDYAFVNFPGSTGWRLALGLQLIPAIVCLGGLLFMIPQSPRHSIDKSNLVEALETLAKTRGNGTIADTAVLMEFHEIKQNISFEHKFQKNPYKRIVLKGYENNRKRLLIGIAAQVFQQLTGVTAILTFAPQIFQSTSLNDRYQALLANGLSGTINALAAIPAMIFFDRWGRRRTMILGSLLLCMSMVVLAILSAMHGFTYNTSTSTLQATTTDSATEMLYIYFDGNGPTIGFLCVIYLCVAIYSCTWGTLGWIYPTELYSQGVRAKALGISTAFNWLMTFAMLQLIHNMLKKITWKTYVVLAVFSLIAATVVYLYFPETNGKSLEEVDLIFSGGLDRYDVDAHHPQTAAEALAQMEEVQQTNKDIYRFPFTPERRSSFRPHQKRSLIPNYVVSKQPAYTFYY